MKKLLCILLATVMVLGLCACGGAKEDPNALQAGFARLDCIPDDPLVHIAGGDAASDPATDGLLDNLAVTCIALKQGENTYLIYTCDIVDIVDFYKLTESIITKETGVPAENIILNATHTHSAPTLKPSDAKLPGQPNYTSKFNATCKDAAVAAIADLSAVSGISYGSIMTEKMVRVRHYLMKDGTTYGNGHGSTSSGFQSHLYDADEECQVIRIARTAEDKKDIVMFNLGAHATTVSGTNTSALSADFPFPARTYIEDEAGVLAAYFIAAAGDQTPGSKIAGEVANTNHNAQGEALGAYVVEYLNNMTDSASMDVKLHNEIYVAGRMKDGIEDTDRVAKANEIMALRSQYGQSSSQVKDKCKEYGFANYYEASGLVTRSKAPETGSFPIATMLLGDVGLCFFAGEMFGSQGRKLKDESPTPMTFVVTCSEDDQGYFPDALAKEESFYEYDQTKYEMGTGEAVAERYCEILTALRDGTEVPAR
ncbi:MAG: hypothetical protein IKU07_07590 [Oscillospiraceae bacterium]|nr:hypothetical protein [Oscillospiraceae bacterium]